MNIKNLIGITPLNSPVSQVQGVSSREIKSDSSHERDANGQEAFHKQKKREKLNREQAEKALKTLLAKDFMKDMKWSAELNEKDDHFSILVKDSAGQLIREMSENAIWELILDTETDKSEKNKGNLLSRVA